MTDITPVVRFDLRASYEELVTPIDDEQDAAVWREIALAALEVFATATQRAAEERAAARQRVSEGGSHGER